MIESNYVHRRRFQNSFCVSVMGWKGGICPGGDKGALSAWIAVGSCVADQSSCQNRTGDWEVLVSQIGQDHRVMQKLIVLYKYAFIRHFLGQGREKELGDLLLKCSCRGDTARGGNRQLCSGVLQAVWQGSSAGFRKAGIELLPLRFRGSAPILRKIVRRAHVFS